MNFDLVYQEIGNLGRYQKYILVLGAFTSFYAGLLFISTFFTLAIPKHRCAIPGLGNDTYAIQSEFHQHIINITIPVASHNDDGDIYDKCHVYIDKYSINDTSIVANTSISTCNRWVYDKSVFSSTLAAKLDMVCNRAVLKSNGQMVFFGGLLAGSLLTGMIADRFGRKTTLCVSSIFYLISAVSIAWTPNYPVYLLLIFAVGFFSVGNFMPGFVMGMEFTGPSKRRFAGQIGSFFWVFGNLILAGLGFGIRDWQTLQIVCAAPGILFMLYWMIVVCMAYYGLALNSGDLAGDLFLNFFVQSFMDVPGNLCVILLLDKLGRKPLQAGSMLIGGVALMSTIFTIIYGGSELQWLTTTFAMIGKIGASAGFSMVYQYSAELFPTVVRNAGMGSSSCMARVGGMIAPYVADLDRLIGGHFGKALPLIIFGSLSIVAGILALFLPETLNKHLPETIEDGEKFGTDQYMKEKTAFYSVNQGFQGEAMQVKATNLVNNDQACIEKGELSVTIVNKNGVITRF